MPTYEYKCDGCGHAFEKFQPITSAAVKKCPVCGKNKVRRLISMGAGLIFKGSGFYITDYRDAGYKDQAKADAGPSTDTAAKPDTAGSKSDAPAATPTGDKAAASAPAPAKESAPSSGASSKPSKSKKDD